MQPFSLMTHFLLSFSCASSRRSASHHPNQPGVNSFRNKCRDHGQEQEQRAIGRTRTRGALNQYLICEWLPESLIQVLSYRSANHLGRIQTYSYLSIPFFHPLTVRILPSINKSLFHPEKYPTILEIPQTRSTMAFKAYMITFCRYQSR